MLWKIFDKKSRCNDSFRLPLSFWKPYLCRKESWSGQESTYPALLSLVLGNQSPRGAHKWAISKPEDQEPQLMTHGWTEQLLQSTAVQLCWAILEWKWTFLWWRLKRKHFGNTSSRDQAHKQSMLEISIPRFYSQSPDAMKSHQRDKVGYKCVNKQIYKISTVKW